MKKPFEVGERVAVYNLDPKNHALAPHHCEIVGTREPSIDGSRWLEVRLPMGTLTTIHSKQCRRLVKKKRRSVWLNFDVEGFIEFREVRKK